MADEMGTPSEAFLRGSGEPLIEIGPMPTTPQLPDNLVALRVEGTRGDLFVAAHRVWRRASPYGYSEVQHTIDGVPVIAVAELAEFDRKAAAAAKRAADDAEARRRWLEQNRREVTLGDLLDNWRLPTLAGAHRIITDDHRGTVEVDRTGRLRIELAPVWARRSRAATWRGVMRSTFSRACARSPGG
jgi:hypothetical protein